MKIFSITTLILLFIIPYKTILSQTVSGKIINTDSTVLSFSTVYVKNTTLGVMADYNGNYFIELKAGNYTLVYNYLGHKPVEKNVEIKSNERLTIDVVLEKSDLQINEVEIVANKRDKAKKIMESVRENRKNYLKSVVDYSCDIYVKTSIEKEYEKEIEDSTKKPKDFETFLKKENLNLVEYVGTLYYRQPNKYKEIINAYNNFSEEKPVNEYVVSIGYGENDIVPRTYTHDNPYIFYQNSSCGNFNFYENLLDFPTITDQPLVSPISYNSSLYYRYEFEISFFEGNKKINRIKVIPLNNVGALFYGDIYIEDSTWALVSVNLSVNEKAMTLYENFNIIQNYEKISDSVYLPVKTDITYTIKNGKEKILGNSKIVKNNYKINQNFDSKIFTKEIITYQIDAFDKDSLFWDANRQITLKEKELKFINKSDSLREYYTSDKYLDEQDSVFSRITWWSPIVGVGYKNHYIGIEFWLSGILEQINPFGVGGYRHKLSFYLNKHFDNGMMLETRPYIDYGFKNRDFKGKFGIGLTYIPKKFVRTYIEIGDYYDMINNYASIEQTFSRSNYVRNQMFFISQRIEIINGLYSELSFTYTNQIPINNLELENWSDWLFGELNEPIDFEQYIKYEVKLELKYMIGQKYIIKNNRKIILGTEFPEISFLYRKGIPELFRSEVNFDYIEFGAKDEMQIARFGESRWQIKAGIFANKKNLRVLEYKYFRGSDKFFFSDPVKSMQLLGPTMFTNSSFLQANYIHHFNGYFLHKVPLFKYLKLSLAAGTGTLYIPDQNFYHFEMYGGIEKIFRIKTEIFRIGIYAVTSDNNLSKADFTFKIGLSGFNQYTKKWDY